MTRLRSGLLPSLFVWLVCTTSPVQAQEAEGTQDACADAYVAAQRARNAGKLREAHAEAVRCGQEACSQLLRGDCVAWSRELEARIPTVIVEARYDDGNPPAQPELHIDGKVVTADELARAIPLDPGEHHFALRDADGASAELTFRVVEGVKGQHVSLSLVRPAAPTPPPAPTSARRASLALLTISAAGLLSFGTLATLGLVHEHDLERDCAPRCARSRAEPIERLYLAADVSLGIAVATGAAGLWTWLWQRSHAPVEALSVAPLEGGGHLTLCGRF